MAKGGIEFNAVPIPDDLKSLGFDVKVISAAEKVTNKGNHESLQVRGGNIDAANHLVNDLSDVKATPEKLHLLQEPDVGIQHFDTSNSNRHEHLHKSDQVNR